jgi:hypothetical protein
MLVVNVLEKGSLWKTFEENHISLNFFNIHLFDPDKYTKSDQGTFCYMTKEFVEVWIHRKTTIFLLTNISIT